MLNNYLMKWFFNYIYKRIWRILFSSNFKRFGKSAIAYPWLISGAEYIEIGDHVDILYKVWLHALKIDENTPRLIIGNRVRINRYVTISAVREVLIGNNVNIAERTYIADNTHEYKDITLPVRDQPIVFKNSVHIGDDTWIGANVSIIGAKIGKHCVIGANSVVTRDIPDYCVAAGAPARVIKKYNFKAMEWQRVDANGKFIAAGLDD